MYHDHWLNLRGYSEQFHHVWAGVGSFQEVIAFNRVLIAGYGPNCNLLLLKIARTMSRVRNAQNCFEAVAIFHARMLYAV